MTNIMTPSRAGTAGQVESDDARELRSSCAGTLGENEENQGLTADVQQAWQLATRQKHQAPAAARLALAVHELHRFGIGSFLIVRAGFMRHATGLAASTSFLRDAGVRHG